MPPNIIILEGACRACPGLLLWWLLTFILLTSILFLPYRLVRCPSVLILTLNKLFVWSFQLPHLGIKLPLCKSALSLIKVVLVKLLILVHRALFFALVNVLHILIIVSLALEILILNVRGLYALCVYWFAILPFLQEGDEGQWLHSFVLLCLKKHVVLRILRGEIT